MLGHHVSRLGVSTAAEKIEVVKSMKFPSNLKELEAGKCFGNRF
jgi:hypothetical protein